MDLVLNQGVKIKDEELKKVTAEIRKAGANVIGNTFKISALIAKVDADKLYVNDGFADTFDYVKQCFGLEKASAYNLIRVGKEFIEGIENDKGNVTSYATILTHADKDFSISQVFKMLPLGIDKAKELTTDEVITPDMSCRAIEKIVKENTEGTKARGKAKTEPDEPDETETDDAVLLVEWETVPDEIREFFTHEYDLEGITSIEISGLE